jgi:L-alanine-DL-glutamate epimerase-like enolase superfamily enzyme
MDRRQFLTTGAVAGVSAMFLNTPFAAAQSAIAGRVKIKNVRIQYLKLEKDMGSFVDYVGRTRAYRIGGGSMTVIETDAGDKFLGYGGGISPTMVAAANRLLVGKDPFDVEVLAERIKGLGRGSAGLEVALWDLIGKLANQPLYKLWGGGNGRDYVTPYSSHFLLETPKERGALAARLKAQGWKAMKVKAHYQTLKEDIALCEEIRKQAGDDFKIMVDANKAGLRIPVLSPTYVPWDYRRAYETAKAYEALNVYFLEEPLPRFDLRQLAELNRSTAMYLAGGESNEGLHEFKDLMDQGCFDIIQPEINGTGVLEIKKLLVMAEADYRLLIPHLGDARFSTTCLMHLSASSTNMPHVEMSNEQPIGDYKSSYAIFENPPVVRSDGTIKMSDLPGLGLIPRKDLYTDTPAPGGAGLGGGE